MDSKAYSNTLLLPKTPFPIRSPPAKREAPYHARTCDELYRWQWEQRKDAKVFVTHDGPPYANGDLHIGHALNKIIKDIINRYYVSRGYRVHYKPGWDCHGLPIENRALQELRTDSISISPTAIREAAQATARREIERQKEQFSALGIMADWSEENTYRTLDHDYEMRQLHVFRQMVEKGLIYRHYRPVHYSPSSRSALAEAELTYEDDHVSHSVYVLFDVDMASNEMREALRGKISDEELNDMQLLVWTTTPWTLTANMGIAVHPDMVYNIVRRTQEPSNGFFVVAQERLDALSDLLGPIEVIASIQGTALLHTTYRPIFGPHPHPSSALKIVPAPHVNAFTGTGLVHCAPAHGAEDYNAFRALGLLPTTANMICHVDSAGAFTPGVAEVVGPDVASQLVGQEVLGAGSRAVVEALKSLGRVVKVQRFKHRYPYDWKTNKPIIVTATSQWFANLDDVKDDAVKALRDVRFFPPQSRNRLETYIASRSEWCMSRQRVWGVPIPALYHIPTDRAVLDATTLGHILPILDTKGGSYWWDAPIEELIPPAYLDWSADGAADWRKGTDTMDVWFDSGSSWSMLPERVGGPPADVCVEGSDQHRGWFQSQLLTRVSVGGSGASSPYGALITHGMVLDEHGKKMSKSAGNIISHLTVINGGKDLKKEPAHGADVLRLWSATVEYWNDMAIGHLALEQSAEALRKIRNSARFILGTVGSEESRREFKLVSVEDMSMADRYVMNELYNLEQLALREYPAYQFPKVMSALINFANVTLSSFYFDITKDCLYANPVQSVERRAVVTVFVQTLKTMTSILAPVLPHLAEEIHEALHESEDGQSFFNTQWTPLSDQWKNDVVKEDIDRLLHVRSVVLSLLEKARMKKDLKSSLEAEVLMFSPEHQSELVSTLTREADTLKTMFIVSDVKISDWKAESSEWIYSDIIADDGNTIDICIRPSSRSKCPRCWTYTRESSDALCGRCTTTLANATTSL